jgi:hypothetical protein
MTELSELKSRLSAAQEGMEAAVEAGDADRLSELANSREHDVYLLGTRTADCAATKEWARAYLARDRLILSRAEALKEKTLRKLKSTRASRTAARSYLVIELNGDSATTARPKKINLPD